MLGERFRYMDAAARIKPSRDRVRDEARKAEVIANVAARGALSEGVDPDAASNRFTSAWSKPRSPTSSRGSTRSAADRRQASRPSADEG